MREPTTRPVSEHPSYVVVGRGRWAGRVQQVLDGQHRRVAVVSDARRRPDESSTGYTARLGGSLGAAGAQIAWLCVPPGPHVPALTHAALDAGLHVIAEKPWRYPEETETLARMARSAGLVVGVDFEYCLLDGVQRWAAEQEKGAGLRFGGEFTVTAGNRLGISAADNLGSHLLAIRELAAPAAEIGDITCGYERSPARRVWLDGPGGRIAEIDFADNTEPIMQRFVAGFEDAVDGGTFALDLAFAQRVAALASDLEARRDDAT